MSFQLKPSPEEEAKTAMVGLTTFFDNMFTYDSAWKSANGIEAMRVIMKRADADLTKAKGPAEKIDAWIPTTTEDKAKKIRIKDKFGSCCMTIAGMKAQITKKVESKQRRREKRERATPVPSLIQTTFSVPAGTGKEPKEEVQLFFQESPPSPRREERVSDPTVSVVLESPPESPSIDKDTDSDKSLTDLQLEKMDSAVQPVEDAMSDFARTQLTQRWKKIGVTVFVVVLLLLLIYLLYALWKK